MTVSARSPGAPVVSDDRPQVAVIDVPGAGGSGQVTSLTYDARVFFDTDRDRPRPEAAPVLALLVNRLQTASGAGLPHVAVVGHTDDVGSDAYNMALSRRRAREIVRELVGRGLPAADLQAIGVGLREPLPGSGADDASRARNRRVEFLVGPSRRAVDSVLAARHPAPLAVRANRLQAVRLLPRTPDSVSRAPLGTAVTY